MSTALGVMVTTAVTTTIAPPAGTTTASSAVMSTRTTPSVNGSSSAGMEDRVTQRVLAQLLGRLAEGGTNPAREGGEENSRWDCMLERVGFPTYVVTTVGPAGGPWIFVGREG